MPNVLVVAELGPSGDLKGASLSAVNAAKQMAPAFGGSFDILVLGKSTEEAAKKLGEYGAGRILTCTDPSLENYVAEHFAPTVAQVGAGYGALVGTATTFGKDLLPRVAAKLDAAYAGDCSAIQVEGDKVTYQRPMFAGNAFGHCQLSTEQHVITVRQSEIDPAEASGGSSPVESVDKVAPSAAAERVEFVSLDAVESERPELTEAQVVVSGGRALKDQFFEVMEPLADVLGAGLGASRAAVDAGYCPGDFQVGQTGKIVAPQLYVAVGISGAIQHVAGMKGSKVIVAINKDPDAPIFQIADYGLVADLFEAVPQLVDKLKAQKSA